MTNEEARDLRVGEDIVFVAEPGLEEIIEMKVVRIALNTFSNPTSTIMITGYSKTLSARIYNPSEVYKTWHGAMRKLIDIQQVKADQALSKKRHLLNEVANLDKGV